MPVAVQQTDADVPNETVRALLERGVLYSSVIAPASLHKGDYTSEYYATAPATISLWCDHAKCSAIMEWDREGQFSDSLFGGVRQLTYVCRHSPERRTTFIVLTARESPDMRVELVGRAPRFRPHIATGIANALGEHDKHWYSQALESRSRDMGVAALAYMRRVVENEMNRILEFLINQLSAEDGKPEDVAALTAAQQLQGENSFEPKARAADTVLPSSFFPGDRNPFVTLHKLCSEGVHSLDDVESVDRFDEAKDLFELLFEKLARQAEGRRLFADRLQKLKPRLKT